MAASRREAGAGSASRVSGGSPLVAWQRLRGGMALGLCLFAAAGCALLPGGPSGTPAGVVGTPTPTVARPPTETPTPTRTPLPLPGTPVRQATPTPEGAVATPTRTPSPTPTRAPTPSPTPTPTRTPTPAPTPTPTPAPLLTNDDSPLLAALPGDYQGYPVRLVMAVRAGPFLRECFRCPPPPGAATTFAVMQPALSPGLEAFLFSRTPLVVPDTGLLARVTGTVRAPVDAETVYGVRRQVPSIEVSSLQVVFANETWSALVAGLDRYLRLYPDAPVVLQGQVAAVEARGSFSLLRVRSGGFQPVEPDALFSLPSPELSVASGDYVLVWGRLRAKEGGLPLVVADGLEVKGREPLPIPPITSLLGLLP